jgi:uncharacterized protein YgiM (DUF1202 family)
MKLNVWIVAVLAPLTAVMVMAQDTAPAPPTPKRKASSVKKRVVLDAPAPAVVKSANVNVRGQASFIGETLGHLQKGDPVTVLERITLSHPTTGEPAEWAQIALPAGIPVWVNADCIDAEAKAIKVRKVNLRGGPGENYSVVGRLEKGAAIKEIKTEKGWVSIEAPTNAYAFVAAEFLDMQSPPAVAVTLPPLAPAPEPQVVNINTPAPPAIATNEPIVAAPTAPSPTEPPSTPPAPIATPPAEPAPTPAPAPVAPSEPVITPRVVTREGFVRTSYNIQAPTDYELHDVQSGTLIDYLQPKPGQNFKIFVGTRIMVTGPEGMDPRWPRTPVLQVQTVDLTP